MKEYTKAGFLQEPGIETPVFVRFSNFIGNKGSKDTAIDVRICHQIYTQEGIMTIWHFSSLCLFDGCHEIC